MNATEFLNNFSSHCLPQTFIISQGYCFYLPWLFQIYNSIIDLSYHSWEVILYYLFEDLQTYNQFFLLFFTFIIFLFFP